MLKERIQHSEFSLRDAQGNILKYIGEDVFGYCMIEGYCGELSIPIKQKDIINEKNEENYFLAEVDTSVFESDYHTYGETHNCSGVFMAFDYSLFSGKWFDEERKKNFIEYIKVILNERGYQYYITEIKFVCQYEYLKIVIMGRKLDDEMICCVDNLIKEINKFKLTREYSKILVNKKTHF